MARKGSSLDAFLEYFPSRRAILNRHFDGESPSRIDASLGLVRGDARRAITDFWDFDKMRTKKPILAP